VFGYGPLEKSILDRSQTHMLQILEQNGTRCLKFDKSGLYPLDFALGWSYGLRKLVEVGYEVKYALQLAISLGDLESAHILLEAKGFALATEPLVLQETSKSKDEALQRLVIDSLKNRRQRLRSLALATLFDQEIGDSALLQEKVLDEKASDVWNRLIKKGIHVPRELHPGFLPTIFCFVASYSSTKFLDALYETGFESVDGANKSIATPLLILLCRENPWRSRNGYDLVKWFIDRQASLNFTAEWSFPTVLFYFAIAYSKSTRIPCQRTATFLKALVPPTTSVCDPLGSDGCSCHCSSLNGCLPIHKIWTCDPLEMNHEKCRLVTKTWLETCVEEWFQLCGLNETQIALQYREICRLEIFDRLGMAHTCCTYGEKMKIIRRTMDEDKQMQLQEEDFDLAKQLNLVMEAYERMRRGYVGDFRCFWNLWWLKVDEILPELSPEERCRCKGLGRYRNDFSVMLEEKAKLLSEKRAKIEADALRRKGYYGSDFLDVIRLHFSDCGSNS